MTGASIAILSFEHMRNDGIAPDDIIGRVDRYIDDLKHLPLTTEGLDEALTEAGDYRSDLLRLRARTLH
jgi:hypothetical protein